MWAMHAGFRLGGACPFATVTPDFFDTFFCLKGPLACGGAVLPEAALPTGRNSFFRQLDFLMALVPGTAVTHW